MATISVIDKSDTIRKKLFYSESGSGTSEPVKIPNIYPITIGIHSISGGEARIEYTLNPDDKEVEEESPSVKWKAWSHGDVSQDNDSCLNSPISFVRVASDIATWTLEILVSER